MASSTEQINVRITGHDNTGRAWQSATRRVRTHQRQMQGYTRVLRNAKLQAVQLNASLGAIPAAGLAGIAASFGLLGKAVFTANRKMDAFMNSMIVSTGSLGKARQEVEKIKNLSDRLGINFIATADAYKKFSIAAKEVNMDSQTSDRVFSSVATASAAMGLSAENTRLTLKALEQMLSKSNVQAEELRGQLGEHLPGAFGMAAKALGVTTAEMSKMLEQGQILATDLLPKLATVLQTKFESVAVRASKQAGAAFERMSNEWTYALVAFGNTGAFDLMADGLKMVTELLQDFRKGLDTKWVQDFGEFFVDVFKSIQLMIKIVNVGIAKYFDWWTNGLASLDKAFVDFMNNATNAGLTASAKLEVIGIMAHSNFIKARDGAIEFAKGMREVSEEYDEIIDKQDMLEVKRKEALLFPEKPDELFKNFEMATPSIDGVQKALFILNKDIGNTDQNIAKLGNSFATNLGQGLAESMATGKASFKDFAKSILIDIAAMILKLTILRAIMAALGMARSFFAPATHDGSAVTHAISTPPSDGFIFNTPLQDLPDSTANVVEVAQEITGVDLYQQGSRGRNKAVGNGLTGSVTGVDLRDKVIGGRAKGGSVSSRTPYIVGERGAELFVPRTSGTIVPNDKLGASQQDNSSLNITFQINAVDTQSGTAFLMKNQKHIVGMIDQAYRKQGRTGVTA
jgi:tape measure domain-containing protein